MSEETQIKLWFEDDGERERYWRLRTDPAVSIMTGKGVYIARKYALPRIYGNEGVRSQDQLCEMTREFLVAGFTDLASDLGREPTDDERFMFRMGYQALTLEALDSHYRAARAGEKLGEGMALALAGIEACNEGLRLLGELKPPAPAPHLLSMPAARRPLRPADFGCLPQGPRTP